RLSHVFVWKNHSDHAGRRKKNLIRIAAQQLRRTRTHALRRIEAGFPGYRVCAAGVDHDRLDATSSFLQRCLRENDWRGLKSILCKDGGGIRSRLGHDEAEVGTFFSDAGANAGGKKTFGKLHIVMSPRA